MNRLCAFFSALTLDVIALLNGTYRAVTGRTF